LDQVKRQLLLDPSAVDRDARPARRGGLRGDQGKHSPPPGWRHRAVFGQPRRRWRLRAAAAPPARKDALGRARRLVSLNSMHRLPLQLLIVAGFNTAIALLLTLVGYGNL